MAESGIGVYMTVGIKAKMEEDPSYIPFVTESVARHIKGDWGDTCPEDQEVNNECPGSAMSTYYKEPGNEDSKIWVKSEDGHVIALLPSEY